MIDKNELIGFIAAVCTTFAFLPQVIKVWKTKQTKDLSLRMYTIMFIGICLWFVYGLRINSLSILSESTDEGAHLSAEDVYQRLRDAGDDVGLATVYRVLTQFETAGLVERHNFESGHSVFELATDDHHDHMVDVDTNEVIEFVDSEIEARQHAIAAEQGFEIIDHSLVLYVRKKR